LHEDGNHAKDVDMEAPAALQEALRRDEAVLIHEAVATIDEQNFLYPDCLRISNELTKHVPDSNSMI